jgi:flagellar biosynthetic protein FliQ
MDIPLPFDLVRESFHLLLVVGGPLFSAMLVVGLGVGAAQAATQVNDPALSFVPRIVALTGTLLAIGGWAVDALVAFFRESLMRI